MRGELCEEVLHPVWEDSPERDGQHLPHPPRQGLRHRGGRGHWVLTTQGLTTLTCRFAAPSTRASV